MPRRIQSLTLAGPAGDLEALLEEPEQQEPRDIALVCHPHPQFGGTMHNKVVYRIARALRRSGSAVLRFNYRGVNLSQGTFADGEGELEDASAALDWLRQQYAGLPYTLAGFSFGARIILRLACRSGEASRAIAVGFPASYRSQVVLSGCLIPKIFVQSTHDQFGSMEQLSEFVAGVPEPKEVHFIEAESHFFDGALDELEKTIYSLRRTP